VLHSPTFEGRALRLLDRVAVGKGSLQRGENACRSRSRAETIPSLEPGLGAARGWRVPHKSLGTFLGVFPPVKCDRNVGKVRRRRSVSSEARQNVVVDMFGCCDYGSEGWEFESLRARR
jgi:hypothetical protein